VHSISFKKINSLAVAPKRSNPTDAGADLTSTENYKIPPLQRQIVSTGISIEIPEGYYGRIAPRSGLAAKQGIDVLAGVVDSSYRGEIKVVLFNSDKNNTFDINVGDRVAQIIIEDHFNFEFKHGLQRHSGQFLNYKFNYAIL
jgi:dUTP pyrophosphatase